MNIHAQPSNRTYCFYIPEQNLIATPLKTFPLPKMPLEDVGGIPSRGHLGV